MIKRSDWNSTIALMKYVTMSMSEVAKITIALTKFLKLYLKSPDLLVASLTLYLTQFRDLLIIWPEIVTSKNSSNPTTPRHKSPISGLLVAQTPCGTKNLISLKPFRLKDPM
jgi:hypothetical protein